MGTIMTRRRKDGSIGYTAQVRINRGGNVLAKAKTFDNERDAAAWIKKTEKALAKPGAIEAIVARQPQMTVGQGIDRYVKEKRTAIGRTKAQVLRAIHAYDIAAVGLPALRSSHIVTFARELAEAGLAPSTVGNYLSHLSAVLGVARAAWGVEVDPTAMRDATAATSHLGLTGKSRNRSRRPTLDELERLMAHFEDRHIRRRTLPMHALVAFAIFSTRRQEEIVRILWADLEPGRVLVRDMKHPGEKMGNDVWCELVPEAERIIRAAPRTDARIFPYTTDAVSAAFTRACKLLGIEDLHFHDLRHEGVSRLFEMARTVPLAASVSGHRSWSSLQRYTHIKAVGDKFEGWWWLDAIAPLPQSE